MPKKVDVPDLARKIKDFRISIMQTDQKKFARMLGVTQGILSRWENGERLPSAMALMAIGNLAGSDGGDWWYKQAGADYSLVRETVQAYKEAHTAEGHDMRTILIYADTAHPKLVFTPEHSVDRLAVPLKWFKEKNTILGILVSNEMMSPMLEPGYVALIDTSQRNLEKLLDTIAAVDTGTSVVLGWVRRAGPAYMLVPNNQNMASEITPIRSQSSVIGRLVKWVGDMPGEKRK